MRIDYDNNPTPTGLAAYLSIIYHSRLEHNHCHHEDYPDTTEDNTHISQPTRCIYASAIDQIIGPKNSEEKFKASIRAAESERRWEKLA